MRKRTFERAEDLRRLGILLDILNVVDKDGNLDANVHIKYCPGHVTHDQTLFTSEKKGSSSGNRCVSSLSLPGRRMYNTGCT